MRVMEEIWRFKIAGAAGEGVASCGLIFSKYLTRIGLFVSDYIENPSLIRGGHNVFHAALGDKPVTASEKGAEVLIALNKEGVERHWEEVAEGGGVIFDPELLAIEKKGKQLWPVPLKKLAAEAGQALAANTVALGVMVWLMGGETAVLEEILGEIYGEKGEEATRVNVRAVKAGYQWGKEHFEPLTDFLHGRVKEQKRWLLGGNEAIALAAVAAGMKLAVIYPMTPISGILAFLAAHEEEAGIVLRQPEDEIAGINMALGGAFAGARSMVATSGGGFALMSESLSLAGLTETPLVVVFGQRAGPATGIPTWTAQEDLLYALTAAQGEYPRIVLAPGDVRECFEMTAAAFNLAEKYQTAVIVLVDKFVCEAHQTVERFAPEEVVIDRGFWPEKPEEWLDEEGIFSRYRWAEDGISPRGVPGKGLIVKANSDEHDESGFSCEEKPNRDRQVEKRMRKEREWGKSAPGPKFYGPEEAELTLVGWGSVKGPVLAALAKLEEKDRARVNFCHFTYLRPWEEEKVKEALGKIKQGLLVENNYQGQFGQWLRMQTGVELKDRCLKFDGRQFYPEELAEEVKRRLK